MIGSRVENSMIAIIIVAIKVSPPYFYSRGKSNILSNILTWKKPVSKGMILIVILIWYSTYPIHNNFRHMYWLMPIHPIKPSLF